MSKPDLLDTYGRLNFFNEHGIHRLWALNAILAEGVRKKKRSIVTLRSGKMLWLNGAYL